MLKSRGLVVAEESEVVDYSCHVTQLSSLNATLSNVNHCTHARPVATHIIRFNTQNTRALARATLYILTAKFHFFRKSYPDSHFNTYTKMTVVSRAIDPWGAQSRKTEKRFSKCSDFCQNFDAKITIETRRINLRC